MSNTKVILSFIAGAAVGAALLEVMRSEKGKDIVNEVEDLAQKVKRNIQDLTDMANSMKNKASAAAKDAETATNKAAGAANGGSMGGSTSGI